MSSDPQFIRRPEVLRITGLKKSTLYELMRLDVDPFPPNYPISERSRAWIKAEVIGWCERRRNADRKLTSIEKTVQLRSAERGSIVNRGTG
jgi:predicted DNA-binding transcriptional regulator AlpA